MAMTRCAKCGMKMEKKELHHHWAVNHSSLDTPARASLKGVSAPASGYSNENSREWTICPKCGGEVKVKNLKRHLRRLHPEKSPPPEPRKLTAKEKRQLFAPEYDKPLDFLDRPNVVSGGGFGVGKGKKR